MKKIHLIALLLIAAMLISALAACGEKQPEAGTDPATTADSTGTTAPATDGTTGSGEAESTPSDPSGPDLSGDPVVLTVTAARGTDGLTGDLAAVFAAEAGAENVVTGSEQNGIPHSIVAVLSAPAVITAIELTAPTGNAADLAGATLDASEDGVTWTTLKTVGSAVNPGRTYSLKVSDTTVYRYLRIRQADAHRTEAFAVRTVVFKGLPQTGEAGNLEAITAEEEQGTLIAMTQYVCSSQQSGDPANVFLDNDQNWSANASSAGSPNFLISVMTKKTEIRKIVFKTWDANIQPRRSLVQASVNCSEWVTLWELPDLYETDEHGNVRVDGAGEKIRIENGNFTYYLNDTTQYSFIRLVQAENLATYAWKLDTVLIYGVESDEDAEPLNSKYVDAVTVPVTFASSHVDTHSGDPASIWDTTDTTTAYTHKEHKELTEREIYWISGSFDAPTVITKIVYYSPEKYPERVRTSYFEASVDGTEWVKIATLPGNKNAYEDCAVIELTIDDDTAYKYIRLVQGEGFYLYYWTLGTVEVIGVSHPEQS